MMILQSDCRRRRPNTEQDVPEKPSSKPEKNNWNESHANDKLALSLRTSTHIVHGRMFRRLEVLSEACFQKKPRPPKLIKKCLT